MRSKTATNQRLVYLGTPEVAVGPLRALVEAGFDIGLVVTGADKRRGRGGAETPTPVKAAAIELGLPVTHDPSEILTVADAASFDVGVVVAFGQILGSALVGRLPFLNLHFSLLPRWRGAAPVERAILSGDATTGVCVMGIEEGLDTGPIYARAETDVADKTLAELWTELAATGSDLLIDVLRSGSPGAAAGGSVVGTALGAPRPQVGAPTSAAKVTKSERHLDPTRDGAEMLVRRVRIDDAWTEFRGRRLGVLRARALAAGADAADSSEATGVPGGFRGGTRFVTVAGDELELLEVQPEGRAPMAAEVWANGVLLTDVDRIG